MGKASRPDTGEKMKISKVKNAEGFVEEILFGRQFQQFFLEQKVVLSKKQGEDLAEKKRVGEV